MKNFLSKIEINPDDIKCQANSDFAVELENSNFGWSAEKTALKK